MKRLILSLAALAAAAGPLASASAQAQGRWSREENWERREDHYERRDDYERRRWDGRNADRSRRSEYYSNRRWSDPQPPGPPAYYGRPGPRSGYPSWRRGAYLPPMYRGDMIRDYPRYRLRAPPRGYTWYHVERDYMLTGPSGVIFDIVPGD